jgi:hypothetical protein
MSMPVRKNRTNPPFNNTSPAKNWAAQITCDNKSYYFGYFTNEIDEAKAYDRTATEYHSEFASLNLPEAMLIVN